MINLYMTSTVGNYKTGTVTCMKNSPTVTGTGTTWKEIVNPGDILTLDDDKFYIISAVNSNTSLTLDKNFAENTATNVSYRILLNTAAHFPSDTAAKVERALEQLSDINEAAINNDRTVTAATKLEGKGLTSTAGIINLNPPTVNSNTGGQINFHYNQASSATSSIYEDASGRIRFNGDLNINGELRSGLIINGLACLKFVDSDISVNRSVSYSINNAEDTQLVLMQGWQQANDAFRQLNLVCKPSNGEYNSYAAIRLQTNADGTKSEMLYTNPPTSSNSTQIATTAFVNNRLPYTTGTWTPVLSGGTTAGAFTYNVCRGFYIKIGYLVYIWARLNPTYTTHPVGTAFISGLPYTPDVKAGSIRYEGNAYATGGVNNCFRHISGCTITTANSQILLNMNYLESSARYYSATFNTTAATSGTILSFSSSSPSCDIYISCVYATAS